MMFSKQKQTCRDESDSFNKCEKISRKYKGEQYPRAEANGGYSKRPAKSYMTHSVYPLSP